MTARDDGPHRENVHAVTVETAALRAWSAGLVGIVREIENSSAGGFLAALRVHGPEADA